MERGGEESRARERREEREARGGERKIENGREGRGERGEKEVGRENMKKWTWELWFRSSCMVDLGGHG